MLSRTGFPPAGVSATVTTAHNFIATMAACVSDSEIQPPCILQLSFLIHFGRPRCIASDGSGEASFQVPAEGVPACLGSLTTAEPGFAVAHLARSRTAVLPSPDLKDSALRTRRSFGCSEPCFTEGLAATETLAPAPRHGDVAHGSRRHVIGFLFMSGDFGTLLPFCQSSLAHQYPERGASNGRSRRVMWQYVANVE